KETQLLLFRSRLNDLPARPRGSAFDRNLTNLVCLLRNGKRDLKYAILELGFGLLNVGALGQRNLAVELTITPFGTIHAPLVLLMLVLPFTLDGQRIISHLDLYIFRF